MNIKSIIIKLLVGTSFVALVAIIVLVVATWPMATWLFLKENPSPYERVPIDLSKAGSVAITELHINKKDSFIFSLRFEFKRGDEESLVDCKVYHELRTFLADDGSQDRFGTIIPVRLTITKLDGENQIPYHDKVYDTKGLNSADGHHIYRAITGIHLQPGKYSTRLESMKDFPELPQSTITLQVINFFVK